MIDRNGYRLSVGFIVANKNSKIFLAKRIKKDAWQLPQGGVLEKESFEDALFRELKEEIGIDKSLVNIIGYTKKLLRYKIPTNMIRKAQPHCIGQKQRWYLLKFIGHDDQFNLNYTTKPEFDDWQWVNYWHPIHVVVPFKRSVYRKALKELAPAFSKNFNVKKNYTHKRQGFKSNNVSIHTFCL